MVGFCLAVVWLFLGLLLYAGCVGVCALFGILNLLHVGIPIPGFGFGDDYCSGLWCGDVGCGYVGIRNWLS